MTVKPLPQKPSLVQYTVDALQDAIRQREWEEHLPGERQLGQRLQVSRPTLRRALQILERDGWIQCEQGKRRRILRRRARARATSGPQKVVFLSAQPMHLLEPFAVFEIEALRRLLEDRGYRLEFVATSAFTRRKPEPRLTELAAETHASAWVLYRAPRTVQAWFQSAGFPTVIMGSSHPEIGLPSVDIDFRATCRHAVNLLLTRGHARDRLILLVPEGTLAGIEQSKIGFLGGIGEPASAVVPGIKVHPKEIDALCRLVDHFCRVPARRPTGIIMQRPIFSLTVVGQLLARHHLDIPGDISVVALDDEPSLRFAVPAITRYTKNSEQYARRLHDAIVNQLQAGAPNRTPMRIMPDLIRGETLGKAPRDPGTETKPGRSA